MVDKLWNGRAEGPDRVDVRFEARLAQVKFQKELYFVFHTDAETWQCGRVRLLTLQSGPTRSSETFINPFCLESVT